MTILACASARQTRRTGASPRLPAVQRVSGVGTEQGAFYGTDSSIRGQGLTTFITYMCRDPARATRKADGRTMPTQQGRCICGLGPGLGVQCIVRNRLRMGEGRSVQFTSTIILSHRTGRVARATLGTPTLTKSWAQMGGATRRLPTRPAPVFWYAAVWDAGHADKEVLASVRKPRLAC